MNNHLLHLAMGVHRGMHRETNEDAVAYQYPSDYDLLLLRGALLVLADGVAAKEGGAAASQMAVSYLIDAYYRQPLTMPCKDCLLEAIKSVNTDIYDAFRGSSTTIVAVVIHERRLFVAHVGDSRAYRIRGTGIQQLTHDHVVNNQNPDGSHQTNLTRALGYRAQVDVEINEMTIEEGDIILLVTDGVTRYLNNQDLWYLTQATPTDVVRDIIHAANRAGGKDNIGVGVVNVAEEIPSEYQFLVHLNEMQPEIIVHVPDDEPIAPAKPRPKSPAQTWAAPTARIPNVKRNRSKLWLIMILIIAVILLILIIAFLFLNR